MQQAWYWRCLNGVYFTLFYLALPAVLLRLWWRGRAEPAYRLRWAERLGQVASCPAALQQRIVDGGRVLWVHAVSMGEMHAAAPLIRALLAAYPQDVLFVTCTTPTGSQACQSLFADQVWHSYLPYDVPLCIQRVWRKVKPSLFIILEGELWPGLIMQAGRLQVPVMLANARLSLRSCAAYLKIKYWQRSWLPAISFVAAQTKTDMQHFLALGVHPDRMQVAGNLKYHLQVPADIQSFYQALTASWEPGVTDSWFWTAGSVHVEPDQRELTAILQAHLGLLQQNIPAKLILVPRHLRHLPRYIAALDATDLSYVLRSDVAGMQHAHKVLLVDTMGELKYFYAACQVAFVGGSIVPIGGHNLLEPAALGVPVLSGLHLDSCVAVRDALLQQQALQVIATAKDLQQCLENFYQQPATAEAAGQRAAMVFKSQDVALGQHMAWVRQVL